MSTSPALSKILLLVLTFNSILQYSFHHTVCRNNIIKFWKFEPKAMQKQWMFSIVFLTVLFIDFIFHKYIKWITWNFPFHSKYRKLFEFFILNFQNFPWIFRINCYVRSKFEIAIICVELTMFFLWFKFSSNLNMYSVSLVSHFWSWSWYLKLQFKNITYNLYR